MSESDSLHSMVLQSKTSGELTYTELYWLTLAISKRQRRKALSLTAYTAVKSSKTEKNFVREYKKMEKEE
jgi:hypothetical protein